MGNNELARRMADIMYRFENVIDSKISPKIRKRNEKRLFSRARKFVTIEKFTKNEEGFRTCANCLFWLFCHEAENSPVVNYTMPDITVVKWVAIALFMRRSRNEKKLQE